MLDSSLLQSVEATANLLDVPESVIEKDSSSEDYRNRDYYNIIV